MNAGRAVVALAVLVVIGVSLASGPLVGVSVVDEPAFEPGTGSLDATVEEAPETATLAEARHGAGVYHLRSDPIRLDVADATGQPTVAYQLTVVEMNYTSSTATFLDGGTTGAFDLEFEPATLDADRIDSDEYDGVLRVYVYDDDGDRLLYETDVTIEVER